jgi:ribosomal protein L24
MYTGEPYKHMEVQVVRGTSKGTWGRVLSSRVVEECLQVIVEPFSMSTRYEARSFKAEDVVELR